MKDKRRGRAIILVFIGSNSSNTDGPKKKVASYIVERTFQRS